MTSTLSDAEVAGLLREMGQDIGPMNSSTRSVYRRKLERLLLEQSILSSAGATESPLKERQVTRVRETDSISFDSKDEFDLELEEIPDGSLVLEGDDSMDDDLIRGLEPGRRETGVQVPRSSNDTSCDARETKSKDLGDICPAGRSPFEAVLDDDKGWRREPDGNHYVLHGSFSPAPLATPTGPSGKRTDGGVELSQLRQRIALTTGQETTGAVGSFDRVTLKPEDYVPSPRNPLSTYLDRSNPRPTTASQSIRPSERPERVQETKPKESGMQFWIITAAAVSLIVLGLMVLYNMEPGYTSPV